MSSTSLPGPGKGIGPGSVIIAYLHDPRERIWGMLVGIDVTGVTMVGIDLDSFDDWLRTRASGSVEPAIDLSTAFYPLSRVERILLDEPRDSVPSLEGRCLARTGQRLGEHIEAREAGIQLSGGEVARGGWAPAGEREVVREGGEAPGGSASGRPAAR